MGVGWRSAGLIAALSAAVALLLSLTIRPAVGLSFLAGSVLGAASLGAVTGRVWLMTAGRVQGKRLWRILAGVLAIPYYLALAAGLWAAATYYPHEAPWLLGGYIVVLASFAAMMWHSGRGLKKLL